LVTGEDPSAGVTSKSFTPASSVRGVEELGRQFPGAFLREARGSGKVGGGMPELSVRSLRRKMEKSMK
jgi:hypothetical protein